MARKGGPARRSSGLALGATRHAGVKLPNDLIHNLSLGAPAHYHNSCIIGYFASGLPLTSEVHKEGHMTTGHSVET